VLGVPCGQLDEDGYFRTGEVFLVDGLDGWFLRYVDRAKDLVIRGGTNISPAEIEGLLAAHPGVAERPRRRSANGWTSRGHSG
jgi:acyl-CoA synthetase (AMP-forming)/AMP-acid ligase II